MIGNLALTPARLPASAASADGAPPQFGTTEKVALGVGAVVALGAGAAAFALLSRNPAHLGVGGNGGWGAISDLGTSIKPFAGGLAAAMVGGCLASLGVLAATGSLD